MLIDVYSERVFYITLDKQYHILPTKFNLETGQTLSKRKPVYPIQVNFLESTIRRG
jgi:hypothetical protein